MNPTSEQAIGMRIVHLSALLVVLALPAEAAAQTKAGDAALAFIRYITRSEATAVWKAKGLSRY